MSDYITTLENEFAKNANSAIAAGQKAYMKIRFEFYGIKTPLRRDIQRPFLIKKYLPPKEDLKVISETLWLKPQREF